MDIVCCLDDGYVQHTAVMLTSFFFNNTADIHTVHVITLHLDEENRAYLREIASKHAAGIFFYDVDESAMQGFVLKDTDHVSLAAYLRLFIPVLLPAQYRKVLYLDGDIIVRKSLSELWTTDIEPFAIAAVDETVEDNCVRHGINLEEGFFNSGVMLINLDYWREYDIMQKAIDYMEMYPERIIAWDQCALNGTLRGGLWKKLGLEYNLTTIYLYTEYIHSSVNQKGYTIDEIIKAISDPSIVHFTGKDKPWHYTTRDHPYKSEYLKYAKLLDLRTGRDGFTKTTAVKKILCPLLEKLRLLKPVYIQVKKAV